MAKNNYVCFGTDEEICQNDNLYRIIGVFNDTGEYQVKLIKTDYVTSEMLGTNSRDYIGIYDDSTSYYQGNMNASTIAAYSWNNDASIGGSNNWETSELNTINLNPNYLNYLGTTWQNLIATSTWHLGGMTDEEFINGIVKDCYDAERNNAGYGSNPTTTVGKIGLMYLSDYAYASNPANWNIAFYADMQSNVFSDDWLYLGLYEWTITPSSSGDFIVFFIHPNGHNDHNNPNLGYTIRPTFYLKSNVTYISGDGTMENPYRIA